MSRFHSTVTKRNNYYYFEIYLKFSRTRANILCRLSSIIFIPSVVTYMCLQVTLLLMIFMRLKWCRGCTIYSLKVTSTGQSRHAKKCRKSRERAINFNLKINSIFVFFPPRAPSRNVVECESKHASNDFAKHILRGERIVLP